jgi:GTPase SAR1 family protein
MVSSLILTNSAQSTKRLEQIAALRARGIGEHINLPQLVVCGDQSAGKSSVLEGVTGIPFPRHDGVCTKFATEIILQHADTETEITATLIPSPARQEPTKARLQSFVQHVEDLKDLPSIISKAGALMGLKGFNQDIDGPAFAEDVLRIEVHGKHGMQLAIVDLPGLISVANEEQTEVDVQIVHKLVDTYISNPRTIILAVVQAGNDIANQRIIQKSRVVDKAGQRTVGIITKADLINKGTEKRIALLAKNRDTTKLKLGYFILKNPTPDELTQGFTAEQRQESEYIFFNSSPWKEQSLDSERVGINSLRSYLQTLLDQHIEHELPKVRDEIRRLIDATESALLHLGDERSSLGHMRLFLSRLAMRFHGLTTSALNGTYQEADAAFFSNRDEQEHTMRLRAAVHRLNASFSDTMRVNGAKRKLKINYSSDDDDSDDDILLPVKEKKSGEGQLLVTETQMKKWVKEVSVSLDFAK